MRRADRKKPSTHVPTSPKRPSAAYTAKQREQMQRGLRILARMIVCAHFRREASRAASDSTSAAFGQRGR
ncbi:MAG: hypothetical protein OXD46_02365 [Chloroflexi bacterium]|nr:hypothetical protein [Chloroflexota bacterium]